MRLPFEWKKKKINVYILNVYIPADIQVNPFAHRYRNTHRHIHTSIENNIPSLMDVNNLIFASDIHFYVINIMQIY